MPKPAPTFHFDVRACPVGVDVPQRRLLASPCRSPAGTISVRGDPGLGLDAPGCSTIPGTATARVCHEPGKADIKVAAGRPSTQTILTFHRRAPGNLRTAHRYHPSAEPTSPLCRRCGVGAEPAPI